MSSLVLGRALKRVNGSVRSSNDRRKKAKSLNSADLWKSEGMPKRRKSALVSGRGGSRKRRASSSRRPVSAFRLKASAGSRPRGRGLKRFGQRFRRQGGVVKKKVLPTWFKTLCKGISPSDVVGEYGQQIIGNVLPGVGSAYKNSSNVFTHWKHLSLQDIQLCLDWQMATAATNPVSQPAGNAVRNYLTDLTRKHIWRSALQGGEQELQFYQLIPRRDMPVAVLNAIAGPTPVAGPSITPVATSLYAVGGTLLNPTMWSQPFTDEGAAVSLGGLYAGQKISSVQNMVTPFMNPILCSNFKIKRLKVSGPNGTAAIHRLQPGQECTFTGKFLGPHMVSWNKYGMAGVANNSVGVDNYWEVRKGMPVIFVIARGSVAHDVTTPANVATTSTAIDYYQTFKFEVWEPTPVRKYTTYATTGIPGVGTAAQLEEVDIVNAMDTVVVPH